MSRSSQALGLNPSSTSSKVVGEPHSSVSTEQLCTSRLYRVNVSRRNPGQEKLDEFVLALYLLHLFKRWGKKEKKKKKTTH